MQHLGQSVPGISHLILHCPATDSLRRSLFGDSLSLCNLCSRPWGVARLVGHHGLGRHAPIPRKGSGNNNNTLMMTPHKIFDHKRLQKNKSNFLVFTQVAWLVLKQSLFLTLVRTILETLYHLTPYSIRALSTTVSLCLTLWIFKIGAFREILIHFQEKRSHSAGKRRFVLYNY